MVTVREHVEIEASVSTVFAYLDNPAHQAALFFPGTPSRVVEQLPNGRSRLRYSWGLPGISFSGEIHTTDRVPNKRIIWTVEGSLHGTLRWYLSPLTETRTRFTCAATYTPPGPSLLQPVLMPLLRRRTVRTVRDLLRRLTSEVES